MKTPTERSLATGYFRAISLRHWLLLTVLISSLAVVTWLQPVQAASPTDSALPLPGTIAGGAMEVREAEDAASPLAGHRDILPFTSLSELPVEVTDFVSALDALQTELNLSSPSLSQQPHFPLAGLQVGSQPPVITQPNPQSGFPAAVPANRHTLYLPILSSGAVVAGVSMELPVPPFSCKSLQDFSASWEFPGRTQCQALLAFYASAQGEYWLKNDGWLQDPNPCRWYGVGCQSGIGVVSLRLPGNGLYGHVPPEIGSLPLRILDVSNNSLMGPLPDELLEISNWQEVSLHSNRFRGDYPITFLPLYDTARGQIDRRREFTSNRFRHIDTSSYRCSGQGMQVSDCQALVALFRSTGGEDPTSSFWTSYGRLWLVEPNPCNWAGVRCGGDRVAELSFSPSGSVVLVGTLPAELGNLTNLTSLTINNAKFDGPLPGEVGRLSNLVVLSITDSAIRGWIPAELGKLEKLKHLDLAGNQLTGPVPASLANLKSIQRIDLSRNRLSGAVPSELTYLNTVPPNGLHTLALGENEFLCFPVDFGRFLATLKHSTGNPCTPLGR